MCLNHFKVLVIRSGRANIFYVLFWAVNAKTNMGRAENLIILFVHFMKGGLIIKISQNFTIFTSIEADD